MIRLNGFNADGSNVDVKLSLTRCSSNHSGSWPGSGKINPAAL